MLTERPGLAGAPLGRVVTRLRCEACGAPPHRVSLLDLREHSPPRAYRGPAWEVVLIGE